MYPLAHGLYLVTAGPFCTMVPTPMSDAEIPASSWEVSPANLAFVEELYLAYLENPGCGRRDLAGPLPGAGRRRVWTSLPGAPALDAPTTATASRGNGTANGLATRRRQRPRRARPVNGTTLHRRPRPTTRPALRPAATGHPGHRRSQDRRGPRSGHRGRPRRRWRPSLAAVAARRALAGKRVRRLIEDYREMGHLSAAARPAGPGGPPATSRLRLEDYGLTESDLDDVVEAEGIADGRPIKLRELLRPAGGDLLPPHRRRAGPHPQRARSAAGCSSGSSRPATGSS